jgi:hypothetical protein
LDFGRLNQKCPVLYHMAEDGSWKSIQKLGLLSTSTLLDRFEVEGERRLAIESARRPEMVRLEHHEHGVAAVRDNKPVLDSVLRCYLLDIQDLFCPQNNQLHFR